MQKINTIAKTPRKNKVAAINLKTNEYSHDRLVQKQLEPVHEFCRVKPISGDGDLSCITLKNSKTVVLTMPEQPLDNKQQISQKETQYIFKHVFDVSATQQNVFNTVALPLVENLLKGQNSLLFTYGVTGSGKSYTMTGSGKQRGIMPRCVDVLFRTISDYQARKCMFKSDRLNGFEVLSESEALSEREKDMKRQFKDSALKSNDVDIEIPTEGSSDVAPLNYLLNEHNIYAIFVTYIEVYNNFVYDLLEDRDIQKPLQSKILRENAYHNMFVHGVTEKEISSVEEAIETFKIGQKRKRVAQTNLNDESSRSHSIFNIRLVQASTGLQEKTNPAKDVITVSQLSLVDLAGSERSFRTKNKGMRLREAGNINNSLMTLRTCLDYLRENQQNLNSAPKKIPYRDSKLTHLFKNYFEGEGQVSMIVCVNARSGDYDENIQVMKFAELTQEVHVVRDTTMKMGMSLTPNSYPANKIIKIDVQNLQDNQKLNVDIGSTLVYSLGTNFPEYKIECPKEGSPTEELRHYLLERIEKRKILRNDLEKICDDFRLHLVQIEKQVISINAELTLLNAAYHQERERSNNLENKLNDRENLFKLLNKKLSNRERQIDELMRKLRDQKNLLIRKDQERELSKKKFDLKLISEVEKRDRLHAFHQAKLQDKIKVQNDKLRLLSNVLQKDSIPKSMRRSHSFDDLSNIQNINNNNQEEAYAFEHLHSADLPEGTAKATNTPSTDACSVNRRADRGLAVANSRHRRSRSTGDKWLQHRLPNPVPLGTVLQQHLKNCKSVTKLTNVKSVISATKYVLASQEADSDGDVETKLFKGNIIPTCSGGAQVVLDDVECLKQKSPVSTPARKRSIIGNASGIVSSTALSTINITNFGTNVASHCGQIIGCQTAKGPKI